jgi:hypothetical protein
LADSNIVVDAVRPVSLAEDAEQSDPSSSSLEIWGMPAYNSFEKRSQNSDKQGAIERYYALLGSGHSVGSTSDTICSEPQSSAVGIAIIGRRAQNDCTRPEGLDPQSLRLSP